VGGARGSRKSEEGKYDELCIHVKNRIMTPVEIVLRSRGVRKEEDRVGKSN
jgi:hypothetical protein